jgi:hypothetical protein
MKYFQLLLFCFICAAQTYGQAAGKTYGEVEVTITKEKKPKKIYSKVWIIKPFTGGDSAWIRSLEQTLDGSIPYKNGAKPGKYIVSVLFIAGKAGNLFDIKCFSNNGYGMEEAVVRAIKSKTRWLPADSNGRQVKPYRISAVKFEPGSLKYKMDSLRKFIPYPSADLLPPEFISFALRNEFYGEADSGTFYRGHVFFLTLRENCTFIYETFYKPFSYARIGFSIGTYKISGDTILLTYASLLPGKEGKVYKAPTMTVSWPLPDRPGYFLISAKGVTAPYEQRLKSTTYLKQVEGGQYDLDVSKCKRQ